LFIDTNISNFFFFKNLIRTGAVDFKKIIIVVESKTNVNTDINKCVLK